MGDTMDFNAKKEMKKKAHQTDPAYFVVTLLVKKEELPLFFNAVCYQICKSHTENHKAALNLFLYLFIDLKNMLEETSKTLVENDDYYYELSLHVLELDLIDATLNYELEKFAKESLEDQYLLCLINRVNLLRQTNSEKIEYCFKILSNKYKSKLLKKAWYGYFKLGEQNSGD